MPRGKTRDLFNIHAHLTRCATIMGGASVRPLSGIPTAACHVAHYSDAQNADQCHAPEPEPKL